MAVLQKNAKGYGYKYTDIAEINRSLEEMGIQYYQYVERICDDDYIYTVPIINGATEAPRRGCKIVSAPFDKKSNPAQEQGSAITYARRYSLLMAFGLATTDDDAQCMTREKSCFPSRKVMIEIARKHYPEGSEELAKLLMGFNVKLIEDLSDDQLKAIYSKYGDK